MSTVPRVAQRQVSSQFLVVSPASHLLNISP